MANGNDVNARPREIFKVQTDIYGLSMLIYNESRSLVSEFAVTPDFAALTKQMGIQLKLGRGFIEAEPTIVNEILEGLKDPTKTDESF